MTFFPLVNILCKQWVPGKAKNPKPKVLTIKKDSAVFMEYFDQVQEQLETLASMDDLLSGENIVPMVNRERAKASLRL